MKRVLIISALLLGITAGASAQASLQGILEMNATIAQSGEEIPATFSLKGDRMKLVTDFGMGETSVYFDKATDRLVAILAALNMGYELNAKELQARKGEIVTPTAASNGKQESINNVTCDGFICQFANGLEMEIWATRDIPNGVYKALLQSFAPSIEMILKVSTASIADLVEKGYAPVRTIVRKDGIEKARVTINKFEEQSLADALFAVPTNVTIQRVSPSMFSRESDEDSPGN
jgi:hypothetical protein